jgi:hypothetical protein
VSPCPELAALVAALGEVRTSIRAAIDREESAQTSALLRDAGALVVCLTRIVAVAGCSVADIHAAFGAPGDWGYDTPLGDALARLYSRRHLAIDEVVTWRPPTEAPVETPPGMILLGWIGCRRTGKRFFCPLYRRSGAWCLQSEEPLPEFVEVRAFAFPPVGPESSGDPLALEVPS